MSTRFSPLAQKNGAVIAEPETTLLAADAELDSTAVHNHTLPAGLPLHYGDLLGEQQRLGRGEAVAVLPYGVVRVSGPERGKWLTSLASQRFDDLSERHDKYWRHALWLDPHGHISFMAWGAELGDAIILVTPDAEGLTEYLQKMKFRADVTVTNVTADHLVLGDMVVREETPNLGEVSQLPGHVVSGRDPWPDVVEGGTAYTGALPPIAHAGERQKRRLTVVTAEDDTWAWLTQLGSGFVGNATPAHNLPDPGCTWKYLAGYLAWEAHRIAAWEPDMSEVDERSIPHELDLLRTAVHLSKGCYCGQETVARVLNLGKPPRRIVMLHMDGSEGQIPEAGSPVLFDGKPCGVLTSSAQHWEAGPIGLAVIKRSVPTQGTFTVNGCAAAATIIVTPEGRALASPAQRPGQGLRRNVMGRPGAPRK